MHISGAQSILNRNFARTLNSQLPVKSYAHQKKNIGIEMGGPNYSIGLVENQKPVAGEKHQQKKKEQETDNWSSQMKGANIFV